jgi:sterol desaturase/sphingolipid hydroxylase (fatty acid hydroxylase superfamily)
MEHHTDIFTRAVPAFVVLVIAEAIFLLKHGRFQSKDIALSTTVGVGFIVISFFSKALLLLIYQLIYTHRIYTFPTNGLFIWAGCFIADDFTYYWFHRLSHRVRILWASHSVHHSSEIYSLSSAGFRQTWTGNITGTFLFWIWLPFIGVEPGMVMLVKSISLVYQFCMHTEVIKKMPAWYEAVFNTPSHHRVHHGSNPLYLDKNYGGLLIIWDRLFGTFQEERFKPTYGLTTKMRSSNPLIVVFYEWMIMLKDLKKSKCLSDWCNYIFNVPGWKKDGGGKTTRQLRSGIR